jgi:septum formation protein
MLINTNRKIILASTSIIRKQVLLDHGLTFEVCKPLFDEDNQKHLFKDLSSKELAIILAKQKALSVSEVNHDAYVIGSDQVCEFLGKEIAKSKNQDQAIEQLTNFSGNIHYQNNAVVIAYQGKIIFENFSQVVLKMLKLSKSEIEAYVKFDQSWGCAGSYKYESMGKHLFEQVSGDYYAVLGLNIQPLLSYLHLHQIINFNQNF